MSDTDAPTEIAALAEAVGLAVGDHVDGAVRRFADALERYREYQVGLSQAEIALVTLGRGEDHLAAIDAQLGELELPGGALEAWESMRRYGADATWGVKLPLERPGELGLYVKQPLPLEEVLFWLEGRRAVTPAGAARLREVARLLAKDHTHFFAVDVVAGHDPAFALYFTHFVEDRATLGARVVKAAALAGIPKTAAAVLDRYHRLLAAPETTVWVSVPVDAAVTSIKLDCAGVRLATLALVLEDLGDEDGLARLEILRRRFAVDAADYVGVRLRETGPPTLTAYLTRVREPLGGF